jgi:Skp family chaperone for outer membrane proteins
MTKEQAYKIVIEDIKKRRVKELDKIKELLKELLKELQSTETD